MYSDLLKCNSDVFDLQSRMGFVYPRELQRGVLILVNRGHLVGGQSVSGAHFKVFIVSTSRWKYSIVLSLDWVAVKLKVNKKRSDLDRSREILWLDGRGVPLPLSASVVSRYKEPPDWITRQT